MASVSAPAMIPCGRSGRARSSRAAGFELGSWGGPGEPTASASKWLPVPLAEIRGRGVLAVHSVRRGADGESEATVRAALRAQRAGVHLRGAGDHSVESE